VNEDFVEFLGALLTADARFLVVGAHALAVHGAPRYTADIDVWIECSPENAARVWRALLDFGAPVQSIGISVEDLATPDTVVQIGVPPRRIDIMSDISGVDFTEAWPDRVVRRVGTHDVPFIGRAALLRNKRASGRHKDLGDVEALGEPAREPRDERRKR
jgi:hypothetical protein